MPENFDRRRPETLRVEIPKRYFREIKVELLKCEPGIIKYRYVKCDGDKHLIDIDTTVLNDQGEETYGYTESTLDAGACDCAEDNKDSSFFDTFK